MEANEYMKKHRIPELFEVLTASLVYNRPNDPKAFMKSYLKQLKESRQDNSAKRGPKFFDESNVVSIFRMLDISGKAHITMEQYQQAMETLGVTSFNTYPAGGELNKITEDTFVSETCSALQKHYQTYSND